MKIETFHEAAVLLQRMGLLDAHASARQCQCLAGATKQLTRAAIAISNVQGGPIRESVTTGQIALRKYRAEKKKQNKTPLARIRTNVNALVPTPPTPPIE